MGYSVASVTFVIAAAAVAAADAKLSRQHADAFQAKLVQIAAQGQTGAAGGNQRVAITDVELNSWFAYHARPLIPQGIAEPKITILGNGKVAGAAIVDLDAVAKKKASGAMLDPWGYIGGKVPVTVTGILHTKDGIGRFQVETAEVSGVPVPRMLLQEVVAYYSRTDNHPNGINMEDPFDLPAGIRRIEVGQGQAVVVQ